jgi:hypothetical protein
LSLSACNFSAYGQLYDDEEKMMATGDTYSFLGMVETNDSIEFNRFSGIYTLKSFNVNGPVTIDIEMNINSGRFKVILVSDDDGIQELSEGINQITVVDDRARLRIVGDDAKGSLDFSIQTPETL